MKKLIFVSWLLSAVAMAQVYTSVTATLQDPAGQLWSNATWTAEFSKPVGGSNPSYTNGGRAITPNQSGLTSSAGVLTVTLDDNILGVTPAGSAWRFTICPNASAASCSITTLTITGATMNISIQLNAVLTVPAVNSISTISRAYNDSEVSGTLGSLYINTISNALEQCQSLTCKGSGWVVVGGSSGGSGTVGSGTSGQFAVYNGLTSVVGSNHLDDGVTNPGVITATENFWTPNIQLTGTPSASISTSASSFSLTNPTGALNISGIPTMSGTGFSGAPISYIQINGANPTTNTQNFNSTTPAAPANGLNLTWQRSGSQTSASLVGNGIATNCLVGTGVFATCPSAPPPLSSITAATTTNTINNGTDLTQTWNWALSGAVPGFQIGESAANINTTTPLLNVSTAPGSFTFPLQISQGQITSIVNVPALQINTSFNAAGTVDNIFQINATVTQAGTSNSNWFLFNGGTSGTTLQSKMDLTGTFYIISPITTTTPAGLLKLCGGTTNQCAQNTAGVVGTIVAQGGDNSNLGASARAGAGIFRGGMLTNATPNAAATEGTVQIGAGFLGTSSAIYNTVCMTTTAFTVADCSNTGPQANVMGVATSTSNPIGVVIGGTVPMNLDNTGVIGDFVCRGTVTAGQNHDNGTTACAAGLGMGIVVAVSGQVISMSGGSINPATTTLTTTTPLVMLRFR